MISNFQSIIPFVRFFICSFVRSSVCLLSRKQSPNGNFSSFIYMYDCSAGNYHLLHVNYIEIFRKPNYNKETRVKTCQLIVHRCNNWCYATQSVQIKESGGLMVMASASQPRDLRFEHHKDHEGDSSYDTSTGWFQESNSRVL